MLEGSVSVKGAIGPVAVFVEGAGPPASVPAASAEQRNKQFRPRGLIVAMGDTVAFPNNDKFFHNVYSDTPDDEFTLGDYRGGASEDRRFVRPGIIEVNCGLHSLMSMEILVLENGWWAEVDAEGRYRIEDVEAGPRTVTAWTAERRTQSIDVNVVAGQVHSQDFALR